MTSKPIPAKAYTPAALEVLALVKAGRPYVGRNLAGRKKHLNWLECEGLVRQVGKSDWELTDAGSVIVEAQSKK